MDVVVNPQGVSVEGADLFIRLDTRFLAPLTAQTPFERIGATENAIVLINDFVESDGVLSLSTSLFNPLTSSTLLARLSLVVEATLDDRTALVVLNEFPVRNSQYLSSGSPFTLRPLGELTFGNRPPRLRIFPLLEAEEDGSASVALNDLVTDPDTPFDDLTWTFESSDSLFEVGLTALGDNLIARFFPPPDAFGTFRVGTVVRDPGGGADTTDAVIKISPVNDAPIAGTDTLHLRGGSRVVVPVLQLVSDIDGDDVHLVDADAVSGVAEVNEDGVIDYATPDAFEGEDTITYTAADDSGTVTNGTVVILIAGENQVPVIEEIAELEALPREMLVIELAGLVADPDDSTALVWAVESVTGPVIGARAIGTTLEIDLEPSAEGIVVVELSVTDPFGGVATGTQVVTVVLDRPGDFDKNRIVNLNDFFLFGVAWSSRVGDADYDVIFDLDGDGFVGFLDFLIWVPNFGVDFTSG